MEITSFRRLMEFFFAECFNLQKRLYVAGVWANDCWKIFKKFWRINQLSSQQGLELFIKYNLKNSTIADRLGFQIEYSSAVKMLVPKIWNDGLFCLRAIRCRNYWTALVTEFCSNDFSKKISWHTKYINVSWYQKFQVEMFPKCFTRGDFLLGSL